MKATYEKDLATDPDFSYIVYWRREDKEDIILAKCWNEKTAEILCRELNTLNQPKADELTYQAAKLAGEEGEQE